MIGLTMHIYLLPKLDWKSNGWIDIFGFFSRHTENLY